jgi:hypothetical protein
VLFVSGRIAVDVVIGEPAPEEPVRIHLGEVLRAALLADDAWSVELPPAGATGVSLRSDPTDDLVMSPLGRFSVRQRAMPLDTTISRYGAALPEPNTPTQFAISSLTVGGVAVSAGPVLQDYFAAAQYADMTDDEKLSRPAFELMPSGAVAGMPRYRLPLGAAGAVQSRTANMSYDEAVVNVDEPLTDVQLGVKLDATIGARLARDGAAGHRDSTTLQAPQRKISVVGERYLSSADDQLPGGQVLLRATSYAQAASGRQPGQRLITVGEVS